jgi:hypothetical protein
MELTGKLVQVLPLQSGTSTKGEWKRQSIIIETEEQYPRKVCIVLWTEQIANIANIAPGELITASINIESREFEGRWYTDVRAWRIQRATQVAEPGATYTTGAPIAASVTTPEEEDFSNTESKFDDLPF